MADFQVGEVVDITIKGARVKEVCYHGDGNGPDVRFTYEAKDGEAWPNAVWADAPTVTVTRVAPAEWPPRAGDLWHDCAGDPWFAAHEDLDEPIRLIGRSGLPHPGGPDELLRAWGPMTLVHRQAEAEGGVTR
ncbi:hypothetical protein ACFYOK_37610 [Microbispora bryophytorum]|uniref:hypothetical protein n=1 Tax=Microbispora bryophytorum TaxID=1460882 RepID=UPI0034026B0F